MKPLLLHKNLADKKGGGCKTLHAVVLRRCAPTPCSGHRIETSTGVTPQPLASTRIGAPLADREHIRGGYRPTALRAVASKPAEAAKGWLDRVHVSGTGDWQGITQLKGC